MMKEMSKMKKVLYVLIALVIIVGLVITATKGLKFDLKYEKSKRIEIYLERSFEISDVKTIVNEVFSNRRTLIQKVELYNDMVSIIVEEASDEEIENLVQKFNEKYELEITKDDLNIVDVPHTRGRYIIKPYIVPVAIATLVALVYLCVRYYKLGILKVLAKTVLCITILELLALSVIAIVRIPVGRISIPVGLIVYITAITGVTYKFEKELKQLNQLNQE